MLAPKARSRAGCFLFTMLVVTLDASLVHARLTTEGCLALKRKNWSDLRKCQAAEHVKALKGKDADSAKCDARFDAKVDKIDGKAAKAAIACRYGDDDFTVTDYDTGLQWEKKSGFVGGLCLISNIHCVNEVYTWAEANEFIGRVNGAAFNNGGGFMIDDGFAGFRDWRLPTSRELGAIQIFAIPRIEPIFGATAADHYWSGTIDKLTAGSAWATSFQSGATFDSSMTQTYYVRAVRSAF